MGETLLTLENAHRVAECVDKDGDTWVFIPESGNWKCVQLRRTTRSIIDHWGPLRITRWKPGMEPAAAPEKWRKGYVTQGGGPFGDGPAPVRTVLCGNGKDIVTVTCTEHYFPAGWVVVREAPPATPPPQWEPRLVWVHENQHLAGYFLKTPVGESHRPPSREEMRALLNDGGLDHRYYDRILDAFYGKESG